MSSKDITLSKNVIQNSKATDERIDEDIKNILVENKQLQWIPYNKFKIIQEIGKGGSATVLHAQWEDQKMKRFVALKMLNELKHREEFIEEFKEEIYVYSGSSTNQNEGRLLI
ncbi:17159_t:CDS:2 [Racocetra fulgida]|uniref:17159_t:CDS:1 n=1 Tax=Racocetra fulgida TaxID=60492 RepID=A0A9N8ZJT2_9GLOM|nr:17159_t:CDS:2 [Racocetra fulgida]